MFGVNSFHTRAVFTQGCAQRGGRWMTHPIHLSQPRCCPWQAVRAGVPRSRRDEGYAPAEKFCQLATRWNQGCTRGIAGTAAPPGPSSAPKQSVTKPLQSRAKRHPPALHSAWAASAHWRLRQLSPGWAFLILTIKNNTQSVFISHHPSSSSLFPNSLRFQLQDQQEVALTVNFFS